MIKKIFINGGITVLLYLFFVFIFKRQVFIFPVFMTIAFIVSMFMSFKNVICAFIPLLTIWIIQLFLEGTIISHVIIYLFFTPFTFLLGYHLKHKKTYLKISYILILIFIGVYGFVNFRFFVNNIFAHKIEISPKMIYSYLDKDIRLDTVKNKILVLDFWTSNCGVCFKKFPDFEKLHKKYKRNPNINLYAVNIPSSFDTLNQAKYKIGKYNYSFPILYAKSDTIPKLLGFNTYPHFVILKNGKIRYNGYPNINEKNTFTSSLEEEINRIK